MTADRPAHGGYPGRVYASALYFRATAAPVTSDLLPHVPVELRGPPTALFRDALPDPLHPPPSDRHVFRGDYAAERGADPR